MTTESKQRLSRANYRMANRCANCKHFILSGNKVPTCTKFAAPVTATKVCDFHKQKEPT